MTDGQQPDNPWQAPGAVPPTGAYIPPSPGGPPSPDAWGHAAPGWGAPQPPPRRGLPGWAWALIGGGIVVVVGVIVLAVIGFTSSPDNYGDDARLDRMWDACEAGDMAACDSLYEESPAFSEYEEFGRTCGNRIETDEYCVDLDLPDAAST